MMGSDDIMLPNYVETVRSVVDQYPGVGMIQPGVEVITETGEVINTLRGRGEAATVRAERCAPGLMGGEEAPPACCGVLVLFPVVVLAHRRRFARLISGPTSVSSKISRW